MNKRLIVAAVVLGLITNLIINNHYSGYETFPTSQQQMEINLCTAASRTVSVKSVRVTGGKPFTKRTAAANSLVYTCSTSVSGSIINTNTFIDDSKTALKTWEFYANWAVWSLPFAGLAYLGRKLYAHHRD